MTIHTLGSHRVLVLPRVQPLDQSRSLNISAPHIERPRRQRPVLVRVQRHRVFDVVRNTLRLGLDIGLQQRGASGGGQREPVRALHLSAVGLGTQMPVAHGLESNGVEVDVRVPSLKLLDEVYGSLVHGGNGAAGGGGETALEVAGTRAETGGLCFGSESG